MSKEAGAVIVGIDGSEGSLRALRWAAAEAGQLNRPLHLVHGSPFEVEDDSVWMDATRYWMIRARETVNEVAPGIQISERLASGGPPKVLLEEAEGAYEIVLGTHGLGGITGQLLGSVAPSVVPHAQCPVILVPERGDPTGPVVVGVDGSPAGEKAIGYAFDAASRGGARLVAVHTWSDAELYGMWYAPIMTVDWDQLAADEERLLAQRLAGWQEKYPDVEVERQIECDRPAHQLLEAGRLARLLVVGSRGRGGFKSLLLGSTSRTLMHHAPCPLAVVRG